MEGQRKAEKGSIWFLIADHGDAVVRVYSRMPLGETAEGELSFDSSCAQLDPDGFPSDTVDATIAGPAVAS